VLLGPPSLRADLDRYALYRGLRASTRQHMAYCLLSFERFLGRVPLRCDLNADAVSRWLESIEGQVAHATVYGYRINLLTLWRDLAEQGLVEPPRRVRRIRKPRPHPIAWTNDEVRRLIERARELRGAFASGASKATYVEALIRTAYESGLRRSDIWALERRQIRPDGTLLVVQQKTGQPHFPRIRPRTLGLIDQLPGDRPLARPHSLASGWGRFWRTCVVGPAGVRRGALQQLRRTAATHLAIEHPEAVQRFLGHRSPEMAAHYIDWSIAAPQPHLPPEIG